LRQAEGIAATLKTPSLLKQNLPIVENRDDSSFFRSDGM
jgi:hypothetical protein